MHNNISGGLKMDEKIKLYSLAKHIADTANIRSVGNLLYAYNGICYVFCDDDALNRLVFEMGFQNNPDDATPKIIIGHRCGVAQYFTIDKLFFM